MPPQHSQGNGHTELVNLNTGNASSQPPSVTAAAAAATLAATQLTAAEFGKHVGSTTPYVHESLDGCSVDNPKDDHSQAEAEDGTGVQLIAAKQQTGPNKARASFATMPAEIQVKIFEEVLRKPTLNFVSAKKTFVVENGEDYWTISYHPLAKAHDPSAYRQKSWIRDVCPAAWTAMQDMRRNGGIRYVRVFRRLGITMNPETEIMCFDFHRTGGSTNVPANRFGRFSRELEFSMRPGPFRAGMTNTMKRFERIAVPYKTEFLPSTSPLCQVFACFQLVPPDPPIPHSISHRRHGNWRICPTEFVGFLDLFVELKEAFIIYSPPRGLYNAERTAADRYIQEFASCKFLP